MARVTNTPEIQARGNKLFDGGASQIEVARTLKISEASVRRWFPGRKLTPEQTRERIIAAQFERRLREMNQLNLS